MRRALLPLLAAAVVGFLAGYVAAPLSLTPCRCDGRLEDLIARERQLREFVVVHAERPKHEAPAPPAGTAYTWQLDPEALTWRKVWFGVDQSKLKGAKP